MRICDGLRFKMAYLLLYNLYSYRVGFWKKINLNLSLIWNNLPLGTFRDVLIWKKKNVLNFYSNNAKFLYVYDVGYGLVEVYHMSLFW